jgi:hypothetical protein
MFTCDDDQCIPQAQKCDNRRDCADGSDETVTLCGKYSVLQQKFFTFAGFSIFRAICFNGAKLKLVTFTQYTI